MTSALTTPLAAATTPNIKRKWRPTERQQRAIDALMDFYPGERVRREALDRISGSSNGPDIILQLRQKFGHDSIECERRKTVDRDGKSCMVGHYYLTEIGFQRIQDWEASHV